MSIRVLLADDHQLVRAGIRSLLEAMEGVEVVAETDDGREAQRLVKAHHPDLVLMDIAMAGLNGIDATTNIVGQFPEVGVIILSMHASEEYVLAALRAGAKGYLLKDAATEELGFALQAVVEGDIYLSPAVSKTVTAGYVAGQAGTFSALRELTQRQREILQLIAEGFTTKGIAGRLNISNKTVESHRSQLMQRLDIHDIPGLVRYAVRHKLVDSGY